MVECRQLTRPSECGKNCCCCYCEDKDECESMDKCDTLDYKCSEAIERGGDLFVYKGGDSE